MQVLDSPGLDAVERVVLKALSWHGFGGVDRRGVQVGLDDLVVVVVVGEVVFEAANAEVWELRQQFLEPTKIVFERPWPPPAC